MPVCHLQTSISASANNRVQEFCAIGQWVSSSKLVTKVTRPAKLKQAVWELNFPLNSREMDLRARRAGPEFGGRNSPKIEKCLLTSFHIFRQFSSNLLPTFVLQHTLSSAQRGSTDIAASHHYVKRSPPLCPSGLNVFRRGESEMADKPIQEQLVRPF
jgi:hypothetical protein